MLSYLSLTNEKMAPTPTFHCFARSTPPRLGSGVARVLESHWIIEDLQELTEGWWEQSLFSGWVSTKEFADTGEQTGFLVSTVPETGNQEDDASSWDVFDDEDEDAAERENILKNAVLGMTQSARYLWLHLWPHDKMTVGGVLLCERNDEDQH